MSVKRQFKIAKVESSLVRLKAQLRLTLMLRLEWLKWALLKRVDQMKKVKQAPNKMKKTRKMSSLMKKSLVTKARATKARAVKRKKIRKRKKTTNRKKF